MICDSCHGTGKVMRDSLPVFGVMPGDPDRPPPGASIWLPCPECGGSGRAHCVRMKPFDPIGACLFCGDAVSNFEPGPRGGAAQNMTCRRCGARYNLVVLARGGAPLRGVPLFLEVLDEPEQQGQN